MPFDHTSFDAKRISPMLVDQNMSDLGTDQFPERDFTWKRDADARVGVIPRMPVALSYGRSDRRAQIADGDRAVIYSTHTDKVSYEIRRAAAAVDITHINRAEMDTLMPGGALAFLSLLAQRQVLTELALDTSVILSGGGSSADDTAVDVVGISAGDEFNATSGWAKLPEQYIREAVQATKGDTMAVCEDVLFALLAHPHIGENALNEHSMTEDEFRSWLAARGIRHLIVLRGEAQRQDPRQGLDIDYIYPGVCAIGRLAVIQRVVMNDVNHWTVRDEMTKVDYLISDCDYDIIVGYPQAIRVFTNTLA